MKSLGQRVVTAALSTADRAYHVELRLRGVELGARVQVIGRPRVYSHGGRITLGDDVRLWSRDRWYISHNQPVRLFAASPQAVIDVGARTRLNGVSISADTKVSIGEDCYFAAGTSLLDTNGHPIGAEARVAGQRDEAKPITVGHRVWLGLRVIVLKGVTIGDDAVVGAGSVVTRDIPARTICAGNPAVVIREL